MSALTPKQIAWKKYKEERRAAERAERATRKHAVEEMRKAIHQAFLAKKVLTRPKLVPERRYMKIPGGRAASRNIQFKRPAAGNRRAHHRKSALSAETAA